MTVDAKEDHDDKEEWPSPPEADSVVSQVRNEKILFPRSTFDASTTVAPTSAIMSGTKRKQRKKNQSHSINGRGNIHSNRSCHKTQVEPETADPLDIIALLRVDDFNIEDFLCDIHKDREEVTKDDDSDDEDDEDWGMRWGANYPPKKQKKGAMMQQHMRKLPTYVNQISPTKPTTFGEA